MTGSHPEPAPHRETGTEDANDHLATQAESRTINFDLPALNSMRRTASPSRPYGRYAVGLRPSPDPDAYFDAPNQDKEVRRINQNDTAVGLDRPRSFRNELLKPCGAKGDSNPCLFLQKYSLSCGDCISRRY